MHSKSIKEKNWQHHNYAESIAKGRQTYFQRTGYDNPGKNPDAIYKGIKTKLARGVWSDPHTSQLENRIVESLRKLYGVEDVITAYRDSRYARNSGYEFRCDCYVRSLDLFVEINGHPTHMTHPFNHQDEIDQEVKSRLEKTKSKWSEAVLETWTQRDVEKKDIALKQSLNYLNVYPYESLEENLQWNDPQYENILSLILSLKK